MAPIWLHPNMVELNLEQQRPVQYCFNVTRSAWLPENWPDDLVVSAFVLNGTLSLRKAPNLEATVSLFICLFFIFYFILIFKLANCWIRNKFYDLTLNFQVEQYPFQISVALLLTRLCHLCGKTTSNLLGNTSDWLRIPFNAEATNATVCPIFKFHFFF